MNKLVMWRQEPEKRDIYKDVVERVLTRQPNGLFTLDFFNDLTEATEALTGASGLITELGRRRNIFQFLYPAEKLIEQANELGIPVALVSGSPDALKFVCPENGGVFIDKTSPETISEQLGVWVSRLAVATQ